MSYFQNNSLYIDELGWPVRSKIRHGIIIAQGANKCWVLCAGFIWAMGLDSLLAAVSERQVMDLPEVVHLNYSNNNSAINHIALRLSYEIERLRQERRVKTGETVAISVGNLELITIVDLVAVLVRKLRGLGLHPFIFISEAISCRYGIELAAASKKYESLEILWGCPIYKATAAKSIRKTSGGIPSYWEQLVFISDHIIFLNKVTPDTSVKSFLLPCMQQMVFPEDNRTREVNSVGDKHEELFCRDSSCSIIDKIIGNLPIMFGVGMIQNKDGYTGQVDILSPVDLFDRERQLYDMKKNLISEQPVGKIDLLVIDKLAAIEKENKNIVHSMRNYAEDINIRRIYIRDLSDEAGGNSAGVGYADFISTKIVQKTNRVKTFDDCIAASDPRRGATPIYYDTDAEVFEACRKTIGNIPFRDIRMVYIKDATSFSEMVVSRALFRDKEFYEWLPPADNWKTIEFDELGNIISPFRDDKEKCSILKKMKSVFLTGFRYGF